MIPQLRFGYGIGVDIGASGGGHIRTSLLDTKNAPSEAIGDADEQQIRFKDRDDFIRQVASSAQRVHQANQSRLPADDTTLDRLLLFVPGTPNDKKVPLLGLRNTRNKLTLKSFDFAKLPLLLASQGLNVAPTHSETVPRLDFMVTNDVTGSAAYVTSKLLSETTFKPGDKAVLIKMGGGLGISDIDYGNKEQLHITGTNYGSILDKPHTSLLFQLIGSKKVKDSIILSNLLGEFAHGLNLSDSEKTDIQYSGNGKLLTDFETFQTRFPDINEATYQKASLKAINTYLDTIAFVASQKAKQGFTHAVFNGRFNDGVKRYIETYPQAFQNELPTGTAVNFDAVMEVRIKQRTPQQIEIISNLSSPNEALGNLNGIPYIPRGTQVQQGLTLTLPKNAFATPNP